MTIKEAAEYIGDRLIQAGCLVHRYNAYSTQSVYLKVDAGVACSIRISDHRGKRHLSYRFNLMANEDGKKVTKQTDRQRGKQLDRFYYQSGAADKLVDDVLKLRVERMERYQDYDGLIKRSLVEAESAVGFWQQAYCVNDIKNTASGVGAPSDGSEIYSYEHCTTSPEKINTR